MQCNKLIFKKYSNLVFIQLVIIMLFSWVLYESKPIDIENTTQLTVVVDDTVYERGWFEYQYSIIANSCIYKFSNEGAFSKNLSNRELNDTIKKGDKITLTFYKRNTLLGESNCVVDAFSETNVYRSLDIDNSQKEVLVIIEIILFALVEFLFFGSVVVYKLLFK